ncbi:unnamed protein product [Acanthoscelides obtectus]|uniref:Uncharacterized protein n=1 Tax=Acanthoscelides obtectus TaxID=200917 RepID=A0A9P0NW14_ACAOB|nr:unnamed protein product [Acanthoscelides obtectus]CAK1665848.1 hypothetical protein AOBTE_LOCUS25004 [Acanthoscelides obtectus]
MRNRNRRWIQFWFLVSILQLVLADEISSAEDNENGDKNQRSIFSPRMDYQQWKPLGRGDPLKNDPTYDYVPPVLDRVQYWVDPADRKPDTATASENQKTEILLLGITSKKPASGSSAIADRKDSYDPYVKYFDGWKYSSNQRIARPSFIPSIPTSFFPQLFSKNKNSIFPDRGSFSKGSEQRVPYTMLMPPPIVQTTVTTGHGEEITPTPMIFLSSSPPTTPRTIPASSTSNNGVTVQTANLVYHSSSVSTENEFKKHSTLPIKGSIPDFRDELVYNTHLAPPEPLVKQEFAPLTPNNLSSKPLVTAGSNQNINYVTPPPLIKPNNEIMFKGQVSDDVVSNGFVKIGKPEAEVHSSGIGVDMGSIIHQPMPLVPPNMGVFPQRVPVEDIEDMQTMHPPPPTESPVFTKTTEAIMKLVGGGTIPPSSTLDTTTFAPTTVTSTIKTEETTTTTATLTTGPMFKPLKQTAEPIKRPMYLIIEGHSKVKTYGPSKQIYGINVQETNEIPGNEDRYQKNYDVKHLHGFKKEEQKLDEPDRKARTGNLQTLKHVVQTGLGSIDLSDLEDLERKSGDKKETELGAGYQVVDMENATTEAYHKGIVEEARKMKI